MAETKIPIRSRTTEMEIGNTTYIVTSTYNENARETAEQKFMRLIAGRVADELKNPGKRLLVGNIT